MSKLRLPIDYKNMQLELLEALKEDELYKLQNDAKIRAVEQNVNAAHLKPLKHSDIKYEVKKLWNPIICTNNSNMMSINNPEEDQSKNRLKLKENENIFKNEIPITYDQFIQFWKTIKEYKEKFNYLKILRHNLREKIFYTEIPPTLFVELINTCLQNVSDVNNIEYIIDILYILSKCNRFYLTMNFMKQNEKEMCTQLFRDLFKNAEYQNEAFKDTIKKLALYYEVNIEKIKTCCNLNL
ncbi:Coiled-coil domain-containing protein [Apis cerana cerana]|uniref:Coiled-coil domain-containing protein n=1 Tax=Apis cerana cerana TaxID=94128 RepID=A0A2A3EFF4_APICC|nr:Coiled-coil domain-containing protein [Apis cerana cerana]